MPGRPSSWVNLQDYLQLNGQQGQDMGTKVLGEVGGKLDKAKQQVSNDQTDFSDAVQGGEVQGPIADWGNMSNPGNPTLDTAKQNAGKTYGGPTSLEGFDPTLAGNVNDAAAKAKQAADQSTRGSVIQETYGAQGASGAGGSALDNFLVSQSPAGSELDKLGPQQKALLDSLGLSEKNADDTAKAGAAQSDANAKKWGDFASQKQTSQEQQPQLDTRLKQYGNPGTAQNPGGVGTYGTKSDFAAALAGGDQAGKGVMKFGDQEVSSATMGKLITKQLDITPADLQKDLAQMTPREYQDMMISGVVPGWLKTGANAAGVTKGAYGGLKTPYLVGSDSPDNGKTAWDWTTKTGTEMLKLIAAVVL